MQEIQDQITQIRGLVSSRAVERTLISPQELREHMIDVLEEHYSPDEARQDMLVYDAFGLLKPDFDLYNFLIDLYAEQVAGYYDTENEQMYIVQGEDFGGTERVTYAHEFVHALQDQYYDIEEGLDFRTEVCEQEVERCNALSALLEGDATLTSTTWTSQFATQADRKDINSLSNLATSMALLTAPTFLVEDFLFSYTAGMAFVQQLFLSGGWEAVDQAYSQPPVSTEQILHPDRYPQDTPEKIDLPDMSSILGVDWVELDRGTLGEWYSFLTLNAGARPAARLSREVARQAADGWEGDAYVVYQQEKTGATLLILTTQWQDTGEAQEFRNAFQSYATARYRSEASAQTGSLSWQTAEIFTIFIQDGRQTTWIQAPDRVLAEKISKVLPVLP